MPNYYSDTLSVINSPSSGLAPATRVRSDKLGGRLRFMEAQYVVGAGTLLVADRIYWGKLPLRARLVGHLSRLIWNAGAASSTLTLGDNVNTARYLAATSVTAAGNATPTASDNTCTGSATTVAGSNVIQPTNNFGSFQVGNLITGTGILLNTVITAINGYGPGMLVVLSNAASTSATNTMTMTGDGYQTTDDSAAVANGYASSTDDSTLLSVVAGAALPAGQVVTLKGVYVQD